MHNVGVSPSTYPMILHTSHNKDNKERFPGCFTYSFMFSCSTLSSNLTPGGGFDFRSSNSFFKRLTNAMIARVSIYERVQIFRTATEAVRVIIINDRVFFDTGLNSSYARQTRTIGKWLEKPQVPREHKKPVSTQYPRRATSIKI